MAILITVLAFNIVGDWLRLFRSKIKGDRINECKNWNIGAGFAKAAYLPALKILKEEVSIFI